MNPQNHEFRTLEEVEKYYGRVLKSNQDLQTSACCPVGGMSDRLKKLIGEIHPEVLEKFYGCGSPIPFAIEGKAVLDLGSGTGRDAFILSRLVGPGGRVIGVDMTGEQLEVARKHVDYHTRKWGFARPNVEFRKGYIEDLESAGIESDSIDLVVSNCVINLSPDKRRVFSEIFRVLKPGGELFFSDVLSDRRVPAELTRDPVLVGECLGGAMYPGDFREMLRSIGISEARIVSQTPITLGNAAILAKADGVGFHSVTIRAFKGEFEEACEDYGQAAVYRGGVEGSESSFVLDEEHVFEKGRLVAVCGNTARMLSLSRYADHFEVIGSESRHFGPFACGKGFALKRADGGAAGASCC